MEPLQGNPHKDIFGSEGIWRFQDMLGSNREKRHSLGQDDAWAAWDGVVSAASGGGAIDRAALENAAEEFQRRFTLADNRSPFWINSPADEVELPVESRTGIAQLA